jgi:peptide/nickel transport system substrate-binding protein
VKIIVMLVALALALAGSAVPSVSQPAGDTITWADDRESLLLDPRVSQSRHEAQIIMHVFDALIFRDFDGKFYPWLAEKWDLSKDGKSITFTLRKGVKFHDGTDFNAEAVKFTFDSIQDPKLGSQGAIDFLGPYQSTEVTIGTPSV